MNLDPQLLAIVVCPDCHGRLEPDERPAGDGGDRLTCTACGLSYPVVDDVPVLLVDEAVRTGS